MAALTAGKAKENADVYYQSLVDKHAKEYKKMKAEELRKINVLKKSGRYATLISEIEEIIKTISEKGGRDFTNQKYSAFYLHGEDVILFEDLMQYFTGQGFKTKEFQGWGIHLSW